ncbi:MAG: hypothetical protein WKF51_14770 [Geodermatophilaceae bacterium]
MGAGPHRLLGSPMVQVLESAWQEIRGRHAEVPDAVIVIGAGSAGRQAGVKLGHFASLRWQQGDMTLPEVFVAGEGLQRGPVAVLGTLLHEAAHSLAEVRGVVDTSRGGRYHNRRFAALGRELGLDITVDGGLGWSATSVPQSTAVAYGDLVDQLGQTLTTHRRPEFLGLRGGRTNSNNPLACSCRCPRRIRVAPEVLAAGPIVCSVCAGAFVQEQPS